MNCVFAGTFDPINRGHEKLIISLLKEYENVFVVLGKNSEKTPIFSEEQRLKLLEETFKSYKNIKIFDYDKIEDYSLFLRKNNISVYVRGIRNKSDLAFEKKYEEINKKLYPFITTNYIEIDEYREISSTLIREKIKENQDISLLVPEKCLKLIKTFIKGN